MKEPQCLYVFLNFYEERYNNPIHPEYEKYENPYVAKFNQIKDDETNIFIVPEIRKAINLLHNIKNIKNYKYYDMDDAVKRALEVFVEKIK